MPTEIKAGEARVPAPFFSTVERLLRLEQIAESWRGTPFMPNAAVKQGGVSCQKLVGTILIECGALPVDFAIPEGPMNWAHAHKVSMIEQFMDSHPEYFLSIGGFGRRVTPPSGFGSGGANPANPLTCAPGDMLGFKLGGCVHHSGLVFGTDGGFVHCLRPDGVRFNHVRDATYWSRLARIWRPILHDGGLSSAKHILPGAADSDPGVVELHPPIK